MQNYSGCIRIAQSSKVDSFRGRIDASIENASGYEFCSTAAARRLLADAEWASTEQSRGWQFADGPDKKLEVFEKHARYFHEQDAGVNPLYG
jgi:hypothetical protein